MIVLKKLIKSFICILFFSCTTSHAQELKDTIFVSDGNTVYLIFQDTVDLINVGVLGEYVAKFDNNSVFIKALKPNSKTSSLLIRCKDNYFSATIKYVENPKKFYYDFRVKKEEQISKIDSVKIESNKVPVSNVGDAPDDIDEKKLEKLNVYSKVEVAERLKKLPFNSNLKTLGQYKDKIYISLANIAVDQTHFYFQIVIKNTSSIDYKINIVNFQYIEIFKKGFLKKKQEKRSDLFPTIKPKDLLVKGQKTQLLSYAIPIFALNDNGNLEIKFREYSGNRIMTIVVSSDYLSSAIKLE